MKLGPALGSLAAALLLALGMPALAQTPSVPSGPSAASGLTFDFATLLKAKPGQWADYHVGKAGPSDAGATGVTIHYALAERTEQKLALEMDTSTGKGDLKMRSTFVPDGPDRWKLLQLTIAVGNQQTAMPSDQVAQTPPVKVSEPPGTFVGNETVTTPAGTFACKHYTKAVAPGAPMLGLWINDKVYPTGLVKTALGNTGIEMSLTAMGGADAPKSK